MSIIQIENLSFTYPGSAYPVFENCTFTMDTDWRLGLVGRNGRGKTTLMRLLDGTLRGSGHITLSVQFDYFPFELPKGLNARQAMKRAVAEEAWQALAPSWPEKRVEFTGEARVRCDAAWLGEAVGNLLKNACEHTAPAGRVRVCVERADSAVFLTVEDDGGGVPPEELIRLFERFYRAADDPGGGSGLGLAIAREIVRRHHGTIQAENAARGLRVTVSLPVLNLAKT